MKGQLEAKVREWAKDHNCTIGLTEVDNPSGSWKPKMVPEILPPEGYLFDDGLTSLICFGWRDAWERVNGCRIKKEGNEG